jgi:hypothetical protein
MYEYETDELHKTKSPLSMQLRCNTCWNMWVGIYFSALGISLHIGTQKYNQSFHLHVYSSFSFTGDEGFCPSQYATFLKITTSRSKILATFHVFRTIHGLTMAKVSFKMGVNRMSAFF